MPRAQPLPIEPGQTEVWGNIPTHAMTRTLTVLALMTALVGCERSGSTSTTMSSDTKPTLITVQSDDPEMLAAMQTARDRFPEFWREVAADYKRVIPALGGSMVKAYLYDDAAPQNGEHRIAEQRQPLPIHIGQLLYIIYDQRQIAVERFPDMVRQAFRAAVSGTPGPVHLQFRGNEGQIDQEEADMEPLCEELFASVPPFRPEPEMRRVLALLDVLQKADRPVIVAGGGVRASGAAPVPLHLVPPDGVEQDLGEIRNIVDRVGGGQQRR